MNSFEEGKYYVMTGSGNRWSDFEGPFDTPEEGCESIGRFCNEYSAPEVLRSTVLTVFRNTMLDLAKDDNGLAISGVEMFTWKRTIWLGGNIIWGAEYAK